MTGTVDETALTAALRSAYKQLGIEPTGPDTVRLRDDAPLAAVRRGIF